MERTSVNGVATASPPAESPVANQQVDSSHAQLLADTSSCGSSPCWAETLFTHPVNVNNCLTFTAAFKTDSVNNFQFGVVSADNVGGTRFMLAASAAGFVQAQVSTSSGSYNVVNINLIPLSANTWYFGQVSFPLPNVGALTIWQAGQARPATPTDFFPGLFMSNPELNFWQNGDNGPNLHHIYVGNVTMTSKDTNSGTIGYGVQQMSLSSDGNTWGCPPYGGGSSVVGGGWCVYSNQSFPWTFTGPDGKKNTLVSISG